MKCMIINMERVNKLRSSIKEIKCKLVGHKFTKWKRLPEGLKKETYYSSCDRNCGTIGYGGFKYI
jgi:hypothetical protein